MAAKFEIKKAKNRQFMFNLKASNGEIILTSERYKKKSSCKKGIKSVKVNARVAKRYKTLTARNSKPYFVLRARNNQVRCIHQPRRWRRALNLSKKMRQERRSST